MRSYLRTVVSLGALVLLLIFLHVSGFLRPLQFAIMGVTRPGQELVASLGSWWQQIPAATDDKPLDAAAVEALREQLQTSLVDRVTMELVRQENLELKQILGYKETAGVAGVAAKILGRSADANSHAFILSRGSRDGILLNQPVVVGQGLLLGKIIAVEDYHSFFLPITDQRSKVAAKVVTSAQTTGIVSGDIGGQLRMYQIAQNVPMQNQDLIITSGLEERIPAGLVIGPVVSVESDPSSIFKSAFVQPSALLTETQFVLVVTNLQP